MDTDAQFHWRPMVANDFQAWSKLASQIHVHYPESDQVLQKKLKLFPEGCYVLADGGTISGYLLSHPWKRYDPPPLNSFLDILPPNQDTYYIHDLALAASARGHGMAQQIVKKS